MQSLDDARFAVLRETQSLLQTPEFGYQPRDPACLAVRTRFRDDGDLTPELMGAHWILGAMNDKEVASLQKHIDKEREIDELDPNLRNALVLTNTMLPSIAREMMYDDIVQVGNRLRKKLNELVEDEEGRFDPTKLDVMMDRSTTLVVSVDAHLRLSVFDRFGPSPGDAELLRVSVDFQSDGEVKLRKKFFAEAAIQAAQMFDAFPNLEAEDDYNPAIDEAERLDRVAEIAEQHSPEGYWRNVVQRLVAEVKSAYANSLYGAFDPDSLGLIEMLIEVDGEVISREETTSAHHAEYWYAHQVSERTSQPNEYVVIKSSQPMKCIDARFCRSETLPGDVKADRRELNRIRWRQFWARPVAWVGPTKDQILAVGAWCSSDPEDPAEWIDSTAAQICGVTNRTWRAWAAHNSSQRIPFTAWRLLLAHADCLEAIGRRVMEVSHD